MKPQDLLYRAGLLWRGPARWHWRHYGWGYRAQQTAQGWVVRGCGLTLEARQLANWRPGCEGVHILLSGPSAARIEHPERLCTQPLITVNGSFQVLADTGLQADLYLVSDVGFVRRQPERFAAGLKAAKALACDHRVLYRLMQTQPQLLAAKPLYLFDNLKRPYHASAHWWNRPAAEGFHRLGREVVFSLRSDLGFFPSCTVAYIALQIAAAQSPRRVVLFGLDLNGGQRYYEGPNQQEKSMLAQDFETCIRPHFAFAAQVLADRCIEVVNASPESALPADVFPKRPADACLQPLA